MKKKIEIDNENVVDIAINMLVVAAAAIETEVEFRSQYCATLFNKVTRKYFEAVAFALGDLNIDEKKSDETLMELKKLVLY